MSINTRNGKVEGKVKISELEEYLKGHKDVYGDTDVVFMIEGERDVFVEFDHYKDALTINIEENFEDED